MTIFEEYIATAEKLRLKPYDSYFGYMMIRALDEKCLRVVIGLMEEDLRIKKKKSAEKSKKWREKNPEKYRESLRRYYTKQP